MKPKKRRQDSILTTPSLEFLEDTRVMITGGTGSLGRELTETILNGTRRTVVVIYSRDEFKQYQMQQAFDAARQSRLRFFLGDVRDGDRLRRAMEGVDHVVHAAALKQVPAAEYNPFEFVKTNVIGAENVTNAALDTRVKHVVALSTDKAANPINLYGATKLCSDKLFVAGNSYVGNRPTRFSVVRYGNVVGSRGSVVPLFLVKRKGGALPITDERMTRFWITIEQGVALVLNALNQMRGGEIWVPRIPSMRIVDLARVVAPDCRLEVTGIRPGEKLHEIMITVDDGRQTLEFGDHFVIKPPFQWDDRNWEDQPGATRCKAGFYFGSDNNANWLGQGELERMIAGLDLPEAREWAKERGLK
jgi:UDP-N-acetylglucosamine 4,6-dehydratase